jgi:hypothetical protein
MDVIKSGRLKKELVFKTTNRQLFQINQIEIVFVDIKSIKPEALFLLGSVEYVRISALASKTPEQVTQYVKIFEDCQLRPSKLKVLYLAATLANHCEPFEALQPLSHLSLMNLEVDFHEPEELDTKHRLNARTFDTFSKWHKSLRSLSLNGPEVSVLYSCAFSRFKHLDSLHLKYLNLTVIKGNAFIDLEFLRRLDLSDNSLESLNSRAFYYLPCLLDLNLTNNFFKSFSPGQFQH